MPSRGIHDFFVNIIETCDVIEVDKQYMVVNGNEFKQIYMGDFSRHNYRMSRLLTHRELGTLTMTLYNEFIDLLKYLVKTNETINVSRKFINVRLVILEISNNIETMDADFYLEFVCDDINMEIPADMTDQINILTQQDTINLKNYRDNSIKSQRISHRYKKQERHFEDCLFKI